MSNEFHLLQVNQTPIGSLLLVVDDLVVEGRATAHVLRFLYGLKLLHQARMSHSRAHQRRKCIGLAVI